MKKITKHTLVSLVAGVVFGVGASTLYWKSQTEPHPLVTATSTGVVVAQAEEGKPFSQSPEQTVQGDSWHLLQTAFLAVNALESQDYSTLSKMVHKENGVRFTPFSTVNVENDVVLSWEEVRDLQGNTSLFSWGAHVGSGEVLSLSIPGYFEKIVSPIAYSKAPFIAIDSVIISGNSLENVAESYPEGRFVDFSYRSVDPELAGQDWTSLKLVFQIYQDAWYLVGVVNSQWTI